MEGDNVEIECVASGIPAPEINFKFGDTELADGISEVHTQITWQGCAQPLLQELAS